MQSFTAKYSDKIQGVLSGFDRLIFRGYLRKIAYTFGLNSYLWANHVLLKDFGSHANEISERVKGAGRWPGGSERLVSGGSAPILIESGGQIFRRENRRETKLPHPG